MSTRATYQIDSHTFYIHSDGYPEYASHYFLFAIEQEGGVFRNFAESFIRANKRAEFTESHEQHGDTEFRYTFNTETSNLEVSAFDWESDTWNTIHNGDLHTFINANVEPFANTPRPEKLFSNLKTERHCLKSVLQSAEYIERWGPTGDHLGNLSSSYGTLSKELEAIALVTDSDMYKDLAALINIAKTHINLNFQEKDAEQKQINASKSWENAERVINILRSQLDVLTMRREIEAQPTA